MGGPRRHHHCRLFFCCHLAVHSVDEVVHKRCHSVLCGRRVRPHNNLTRPVLTSVCVQTGYGLKIECLKDLRRKERLAHSKTCRNERPKKVVLPRAVRYLKVLVSCVLLGSKNLKQDHGATVAVAPDCSRITFLTCSLVTLLLSCMRPNT